VKLFRCQACQQVLYFENTLCEKCRHRLGYLPLATTLSALEPEGDAWKALAAPGTPLRFCANAQHEACNWLVEASSADALCLSCRHNRTIPDLSIEANVSGWRKIGRAKNRLFAGDQGGERADGARLRRPGRPAAVRSAAGDDGTR
jgi:hypothetical protein